jgi:hypothetical protein
MLDNNKAISRKQGERLSQLMHYHNVDDAKTIISMLEQRGPNSWTSVLPKINALVHRSYVEQEYDDTLYEDLTVGKTYSYEEQIRIVTSARSKLHLPIYMDRIKRQCEQKLLRLFIVKKVMGPNPNGTGEIIIGLMPMFKLKADD